MRTRKATRGGNRTSEHYPLKGFKYTNPTSSTLNLNLYSKQVGGSCKRKHAKYCKKSCQKLCRYVGHLPRNDFIIEARARISALQTSVAALKTEHAEYVKSGKARYDQYKPDYYKGGFLFQEADNEKCVDACTKICENTGKETCDKVVESVHQLEENLKIESLMAQEKYLKSEINGMKLNQGIAR